MSEATPDPVLLEWDLAKFLDRHGQPITTLTQVEDALVHSARHSTVAELWGVTLKDLPDVIAYTGNGPNRERLARLIQLVPDMVKALRCLLTVSLPGDVSGQRMIDHARAVLAEVARIERMPMLP